MNGHYPQTDAEYTDDIGAAGTASPDVTSVQTRAQPQDANALTPTIDQIGLEHVRAMWTHRRRMAYVSLTTALTIISLVIGVTIFGTDKVVDNLTKFEAFLITAFMTLIGLVGAYMGLATMADVKQDVYRLRGNR